ncbi:MAG: dipeptide epimerase [Mesorhizobium amorphae]|nr:MAG: dipeptide epimerase [Mesorhizobium amorphae]
MRRQITVSAERFPIAGSFTIARGAKTEAHVVVCRVSGEGAEGWGECVPYPRYGESVESVVAQIESVRQALEAGAGREELERLLPGGAARNAVDCALWDWEAKLAGERVWQRLGGEAPGPLETAYTLSLGTAEAMEEAARRNSVRPLLKIKLGAPEGDVARMEAVVRGAPRSRIIADANEGWTSANLEAHLEAAARLGIALVEQPLPANQDGMLERIARPLPVCADESVHGLDDVEALAGRYDAVNIKLDKTGGLSAALLLKQRASASGMRVMVGCMVGTSLAMAPAVLLAQGADFVDLDGPLLLARDRDPALRYEGSLVFPPAPELWG